MKLAKIEEMFQRNQERENKRRMKELTKKKEPDSDATAEPVKPLRSSLKKDNLEPVSKRQK